MHENIKKIIKILEKTWTAPGPQSLRGAVAIWGSKPRFRSPESERHGCGLGVKTATAPLRLWPDLEIHKDLKNTREIIEIVQKYMNIFRKE